MHLSLHNLVYEFPHFKLEASFKLKPGITLLQAPSGGGKSTLLKLICGVLKPQRGEAMLGTLPFLTLPLDKRPISYVDQEATVFSHLTVCENMHLALTDQNCSTEHKNIQIQTLLESLGLNALMHQRADQLSGGQRQRLAFAQALIQDRLILLLDEPFQGLDDHHRHMCHQVLCKRHQAAESRFTLLASHHGEDLLALADTVVQGNQGCFR